MDNHRGGGQRYEIETVSLEVGISVFNSVKIVPVSNFDVVMQRIELKQVLEY
ncbi:MAG TPA: hypothetical protein VNI77_10510 [Nitrososphaera sp.]|nr:hypothetical protein [Nitrososphaera sp.]